MINAIFFWSENCGQEPAIKTDTGYNESISVELDIDKCTVPNYNVLIG